MILLPLLREKIKVMGEEERMHNNFANIQTILLKCKTNQINANKNSKQNS